MTPKEKAEELFISYRHALSFPNAPLGDLKDNAAIQCAIIAVDEVISELPNYDYGQPIMVYKRTNYWQSVKEELLKM